MCKQHPNTVTETNQQEVSNTEIVTTLSQNSDSEFAGICKTDSPEEVRLLRELSALFERDRLTLWQIGDILNQLRDFYRWDFNQLAELFPGRQPNRLSEIAKTARTIPQEHRPDLEFTDGEQARKSAEGIRRSVFDYLQKDIDAPIALAIELVKKHKAADYIGVPTWSKDGEDKRGDLSRDVTRAGVAIMRDKYEPERLKKLDDLAKKFSQPAAAKSGDDNSPELNRFVHEDLATYMARIPRGIVHFVHLDPPYAGYRKVKNGCLWPNASTDHVEADNTDNIRAVEVTIKALTLAMDVLAPGGIIALWQQSRLLNPDVHKAIMKLELQDWPFLIWDKEKAQMGNPVAGAMNSVEICYLFTRIGEKQIGSSSFGRQQVISDNYRRPRASDYEPLHQLEKPAWVNDEILRRFSMPGDIVLDPFGCSASMAISCERGLEDATEEVLPINRGKRRWLSCESLELNWQRGMRKLENETLRVAGTPKETQIVHEDPPYVDAGENEDAK
jgi:16S rRNA G966 N2-methylase RsmD